jgi:MHS family proline/betaine transporter-like MFS transporter
MAFGAALALQMASIPAAMTEMFPHGVRVSAVSVGYGLAYALFGGTAPVVATWLITRTGNDTVFAWYLMGLTAISLVLALGITDRRGQPLS